MEAVEQRWGVLFQNGALFSNLTVRENVAAPFFEHTTMARADIYELADLKIGLTGLPAHAGDLKPAELSGGMRKRAALARALALDPDLLFLDEPTSGLDPISAGAFDELIGDLSASLGLTVFMITHDLDSLYAICDRVAVIADKKVVATGTIDELKALNHPWIQEYFNGPRGRAAASFKEDKDDGRPSQDKAQALSQDAAEDVRVQGPSPRPPNEPPDGEKRQLRAGGLRLAGPVRGAGRLRAVAGQGPVRPRLRHLRHSIRGAGARHLPGRRSALQRHQGG